MCDNSRDTGAWVEVRTVGPLSDVKKDYTSFVCPSCLRELQRVADFDRSLDVDDVEAAHESVEVERSST
jgi:RecJ-like exonuclease